MKKILFLSVIILSSCCCCNNGRQRYAQRLKELIEENKELRYDVEALEYMVEDLNYHTTFDDPYVTETWLYNELRSNGINDEAVIDSFIKIAIRESNLYIFALNAYRNSNNSIDVGLFQINSVHRNYFEENLFDPCINVRAAVHLYKRVGFEPWRVK